MVFNDFTLDLTSTLAAIVSAVIIYFAWKSTNVREDRFASGTLLIIENNRQLLSNTVVREPTNTTNNLPDPPSDSNNTQEEVELRQSERIAALEELQRPEAPASLQSIIDDLNDLATYRNSDSNYQTLERVEEDIHNLLQDTNPTPQRIIEVMDNPDTPTELRRRRLAFYTAEESDQQQIEGTSQSTPIRRENLNAPTRDTTDNFHAENCSNENNENENISKIEPRPPLSSEKPVDNKSSSPEDPDKKQEFRIKLKYLNDELRLVKGSPNEAIGDFKKRNFTVELAAQKLVRLVFNGHVLQPDSKTLKACGLFDNCVVHCLVHNKKPSSGHATQESSRNDSNEGQHNRRGELGSNSFSEESTNGASFVYFVIILSGLSIIFGWYCRLTYSFIFSWYSTIGLGIMTVIFLVLSPVLFLTERGSSL